MLLRRESTCADLTITSLPVTPCGVAFDFDGGGVELTISADGDAAEPVATAVATMRRARRAIHEEVWAQLFIDGVFVDVVRAAEVDGGDAMGEPSFVARFVVAPLHLDGETHRARVCFITRISRTAPPKLSADASGVVPTQVDPGPEAIAEADFHGARTSRVRRA